MTPPIERPTIYDAENRELIGPSNKKRQLPQRSHEFMMCLLKHPNQMVPKKELSAIFDGNKDQVRVYATRLRKIFEIIDSSLRIVNRYGKGYTLKGLVSCT
jgi:DNA-binding response OmpR family regulator